MIKIELKKDKVSSSDGDIYQMSLSSGNGGSIIAIPFRSKIYLNKVIHTFYHSKERMTTEQLKDLALYAPLNMTVGGVVVGVDGMRHLDMFSPEEGRKNIMLAMESIIYLYIKIKLDI